MKGGPRLHSGGGGSVKRRFFAKGDEKILPNHHEKETTPFAEEGRGQRQSLSAQGRNKGQVREEVCNMLRGNLLSKKKEGKEGLIYNKKREFKINPRGGGRPGTV